MIILLLSSGTVQNIIKKLYKQKLDPEIKAIDQNLQQHNRFSEEAGSRWRHRPREKSNRFALPPIQAFVLSITWWSTGAPSLQDSFKGI